MEHRRDLLAILIFIMFIGLTIGYAYLNSSLTIHGSGKIKDAVWDVHFENVQIQEGSVSGDYITKEATIDDDTTVSYQIRLSKPGDYYEFLVDVVNGGTIDAMIESIQSTLGDDPIDQLPAYLKYEIHYEDDVEILPYQLLSSGKTETLKVRLEYNKDITKDDLPETPQELSFKLFVPYIQKDSNAIGVNHPGSLYSLMENLYYSGSNVQKYSGPHKDSFLEDGHQAIYYWNATSSQEAQNIRNNNLNVIFANHCWRIVRTTDTGGVRLLYAGEVEDGQCLSTRSNHVGYDGPATVTLSDSYYYGSRYTYDKDTNLFHLSGDVTTGSMKSGVYTCLSSDSNGTCSTIYYITSNMVSNSYYALKLSGNSRYDIYGNAPYNRFGSSLAHIGYMYNHSYTVERRQNGYYSIYSYGYDIPIANHPEYYYSDSISLSFDDYENAIYSLVNPVQVGSMTDYSDLIGKYMIYNGQNIPAISAACYIIGVDNNQLQCHLLYNGSLDVSMYMGDSYVDNGDGTYTIQDPVLYPFERWMEEVYGKGSSNVPDYSGKYVCLGSSPTCTGLKHMSSKELYGEFNYYGVDVLNTYYASDVRYENGKYILSGDIIKVWDYYNSDVKDSLTTHHYTCFSDSLECSTVMYTLASMTINSSDYFYYMRLSNGNSLDYVMHQMLDADDVNEKSSDMKYAVEAWYKQYMLDYDSYIDDTIMCNDRSVASWGAFSPNSKVFGSSSLYFNHSKSSTASLTCSNITDQFSIYNEKAPLNYKVGLLTAPETGLSRYNPATSSVPTVTTSSTSYHFNHLLLFTNSVDPFFGGYELNHSNGITPVITINSKAKYVRGDGSLENPYLIAKLYKITYDSDLFNIPSDSPAGYTIRLYSDDYYVTSFKLNGELIEGDQFVMPEEDVVITDVQYIPANYSITVNDPAIQVEDTGRYLDTITLLADGYRVMSFDLNGVHVDGNSFVMPAEDVVITNVVKNELVIVESEHNPYPNSLNNVVYYENTFENATSLEVELTYQTEGVSLDWIYLYSDTGTTPINNKKFGGTTKKTETITVNGNYLRIVFRTDVSVNNYYGFKASILPIYGGS